MRSAQTILKNIEATCTDESGYLDPRTRVWINELRDILNEQLPEMTEVVIGAVYRFRGKKGAQCRGVVTKENAKTWVVYETTDSSRPGCRWMIGKDWCTKENFKRDTVQSWEVPAGVKFK